MADFISPFDPTKTTSGSFTVGLPNGGWLFIHNESPVELQLSSGSRLAPVLIPAYVARCFPVPLSTSRIDWKNLATIQPGQAPISQVYGEAYAESEWHGGEMYVSLTRQVNLGNQAVGGSVSTLTNDGNPANTQVVEATPSDQAASSVKLNNDASGFLQVLSAGTLRTILSVVRGNATTGKAVVTLGDAGDTTITTLHGTADNASAVPVGGIGSGTLPAGVTVPAANISGTVASATTATNVGAAGVTAGNLASNVAQQNGATIAGISSAGGGAAGTRIWVGTVDPGASAAEGDIWIKA